MTDTLPDRVELDAEVQAWRRDATHLVLVVVVLVGLPVTVSALLGISVVFLPEQLWVGTTCYAALLVALSIPRRHQRMRAVILVSSGFLVAIMRTFGGGPVDDGRIVLFTLPLLALGLLGTRAGWIAACVSVTVVGASVLRAWTGGLAHGGHLGTDTVASSHWLLQVLPFVGSLLALLVLFTRLLSLQASTVAAERLGRRALEVESAKRRHLELEVMRVSEEERRRLGSELHDGVCQHLTAALLHCTAVEDLLSDESRPNAKPVHRLRSMLEEAIGMAYDVSKGLCPLDMGPDSLVSALEQLARRTRGSAGVACRFHGEGEIVVRDAQQGLHLFRIAQEAVANAVKHSKGSEILIRLSRLPDALVLVVQDDGVGRWPAVNRTIGGMGLKLMRYRAESLGAVLTIDSPDSGGTIVTCCAPLDPPAEQV